MLSITLSPLQKSGRQVVYPDEYREVGPLLQRGAVRLMTRIHRFF